MTNSLKLIFCQFFRILKWLTWSCIIFVAVRYCFEARDRIYADRHPEGEWTKVSDYPGHQYTAKFHFISNDTILVRLYRTGDPELLAERSFKKEGTRPFWTKNELIYDTSDNSYLGGGIKLPPTLIDRLLAKLP